MNTLINLLCIAVIIVFITDITDFPDTIKKVFSFLTTKGKIVKTEYRIHLIDCSLCQIWWSGIIYLLCTGNFTLPYLVCVCLLSAFAEILKNYILLLKDILIKITQLIYKLID